MGDWTFFSNHGHVLVCLANDSEARLRDVAVQVGITERAVQKIVRDLQDDGYVDISKHGRRNRYRINNRKALRHPLQAGCTVGQLLRLLSKEAEPVETRPARPEPVTPEEPKFRRRDVPEPGPDPEPAPDPVPPPPEPPKDPETGGHRADRDLEQGQLF